MSSSDSSTPYVPRKLGRFKDITGHRFGRLLVVEPSHVHKTKNGKRTVIYWVCVCDCGTIKTISGAHLRKDAIRSCGCLVRETSAKINFKHGRSGKNHPQRYLYDLWLGIRSRIFDPRDISYPTYGGAGIPMYEPWKNDSTAFIEYILSAVGERPSKNHSIDRIINPLGYVPGNLRWLTPYEQNRNKTTNRMITANNETLCISDWAKRLGRSPRTIAARIDHNGWTPENAVTSNSKNK
jgi:hypothetical protein